MIPALQHNHHVSDTVLTKTTGFEPLLQSDPGVVFTNIPNLSPILIIKVMTFVLVKIGFNLVFTKHVLARTIFRILS